MEEQSYAKHAKYVPLYHGVLFGLLVLTFIGSIVNVVHSVGDHERIYSASLITTLSSRRFCCSSLPAFSR